MTRKLTTILGALLLTCSLGGCALLSKSEVVTPRYYTPDYGVTGESAHAPQGAEAGKTPLRLGRVTAGSSLRERMMYRESEQELGFHEYQRWTERPENYLRRALSRALFENRSFVRVVSGSAPSLEAELIAFEEVRGKEPKVRVQIGFWLDDDRMTLLEQTVTVERAVPKTADDQHASAVARVLGEALREAVETISERVTAAVPSEPEPATQAPAAQAMTPTQ